MLNAGIIPLKNQEVFDGLLQIIKNKATQIALFDLNWDKWLQDQQNKNNHLPFSELIKINNQAEVLSPQLEKLQQELAKYSKEKQLDFLEQKVLGILSTVLRLSVDKISREKGINLLGIDSLMTVELASLIKKETGIIVSNMELISSPNSRQISKILYNKIDFGQMKQINEIENMSEKELDALIAKLS
jgi:acyl carrier protein